MKSVRKSIALLLALVMVLALSTAAFAAPVTYLDGATLGYTVPSYATLNQNIGAGSILVRQVFINDCHVGPPYVTTVEEC